MIRHTHAAIVIRAIVFWLSVAAAGCAIQPVATGPAQLSNSERDQIGRMAIRGPSRPSVRLTAELDNKGKAAGKTAAAAGAGWLGASFDAAASSNDATGGLLLLAFGLVTTPVVAAGGAVYGAAAADSDEAIEAGNSVLEEVLDSASSRFRDAFEAEFFETIPVFLITFYAT